MHEEAEAVRDETGAIVRYVGMTQDITDRVAAEAERTRLEEGLRQSERSLSEAQGVAHIGSWEWDLATGTARRSQELHRIFGLAPGTMPATPTAFLAFVHPGDRARVEASVQAAIAGTGRHDLDFRVIRPDGEVRTVHEVGEAVRDEQGAAVRLVGTVVDLTERVAAASERARLISAVEQTADSIMITETDGTIAYVNPSFTRLYGYQPEEVVGLRQAVLDSGHQEPSFWPELWASVSAGRTWSGPIVNRAKDGADVRVDAVISSIRDASGKVTSYVQADRDVTHERELERTVERDARNREVIAAALERIDSGSSPDEIAAAACAEIIRLPDIDSAVVFDLTPGSEVLLAAAGRIAVALGPTIAVPQARSKYLRDRARAGPWIEQWREGGEDESFGELARSGLDGVAYAPFRGPGDTIGLIGVGASGAFAAGQLVERLSTLVTFGSIVGALIGPALGARHRGEAERARIRTTIDGAAFRPVFQPIVDLRDGSVVGYEALTRFDDGERPDLVFEAATRAGLGIDLEAACLLAAVRAARLLRTTTYLSLNVSPEFILSGGLKPILSGLPRQVVLEVTEHVAIDDYAALRRSLTGLGPTVRVAVDDAGAGYASFRHILELAPNFVKIDIGLVRGVDAEPARQALIAGMGYFAVRRKLHLIAEGIETVAELGALRALAVPYGQGFLLGRPRPSRGSGRWPTRIDLRPPAST
jgi:PAS domain S-box-containing protein